MKLIIALLIVLVICSLLPIFFINRNLKSHQKQLDILNEQVKFNNVLRYQDKNYLLAGLNMVGFAKDKYPAYTPLYMTEMDFTATADTIWKEELEKMDEETKNHQEKRERHEQVEKR